MKIEIDDLTAKECGEIAVTAAEGGIGYWSQIESYDWRRWASDGEMLGHGHPDNSHAPEDPFFVFYTIHPLNKREDGYDEEGIAITPYLIRMGFTRGLEAPKDKGGWFFRGLTASAREDWTGEIDADGADLIIQFGCFKEVRYG